MKGNKKLKSHFKAVIIQLWNKSISRRIRLTKNGNEEINNKRASES